MDDFVVGILVLGAIAYVATTLGPRTWRGRALAMLGRSLERAPSMFGLRALARRLRDKAAVKAVGACGGCDNCGAATDAGKTNPSRTAGGVNEVSIPVSTIRKRG